MSIERGFYIEKYKEMAANTITKEQLPFVSDIIDFALEGKKSKNLQRVFDFFGDEDEIREQVTRHNMFLTNDESKKFIGSVIAANITDISQSGSLYKQLMSTGDTYRIMTDDCHSKGRKIELPITEEIFNYEIKDCFVYFDDPNEYYMFDDYDTFKQATDEEEYIYLRSPMTCRKLKKHGCCEICAGRIPEGTQNIGAFSTLMITEFATQAALSSMNKGTKDNVNTILSKNGSEVKDLKSFYKWAEEILNDLCGDNVERRFYEIALLGRLNINEDKSVRVASLSNPNSDNYFGEFIYRPKEKTFRNMVEAGSFFDDSLKTQIAFNNYKRGII